MKSAHQIVQMHSTLLSEWLSFSFRMLRYACSSYFSWIMQEFCFATAVMSLMTMMDETKRMQQLHWERRSEGKLKHWKQIRKVAVSAHYFGAAEVSSWNCPYLPSISWWIAGAVGNTLSPWAISLQLVKVRSSSSRAWCNSSGFAVTVSPRNWLQVGPRECQQT